MNNVMVSVVTPTFNREEKLIYLYESLLAQDDKRFEWIIIDDGSTDQTDLKVSQFISENKINIIYQKKDNHGKHTALNYAHDFINGQYVVIVDSDDTLTFDAISSIIRLWKKYKYDSEIVCITFQKKFKNEEVSDTAIKGEYVSFMSKEFYYGFRGDHCEVFKKETFISKEFPVFTNERFVAEGPMWYLITKGKKVVYTEQSIYKFEYLTDGLTKNIRTVMAKNPQGAYWNAIQMVNSEFGIKVKLKNGILAIYYGKLSGKRMKLIWNEINNAIIFLMAFIGYLGIKVLWEKYIR